MMNCITSLSRNQLQTSKIISVIKKANSSIVLVFNTLVLTSKMLNERKTNKEILNMGNGQNEYWVIFFVFLILFYNFNFFLMLLKKYFGCF